jgi:hypothetical protein
MYDIKYFTKDLWGKIYDNDKFWDEELLHSNFLVFYCCIFAWLKLPRPTYNQLLMAEHISNDNNKFRMLMAMRGLAKSLTAQIYSCWRLYNDPNEKILVMSGMDKRAKNFTHFMQKILSLCPFLQHLSPRLNIERTSSNAFDVRGATPSDSPSVYAVGVGTQITGFRATLVIFDDIETPQNSMSATLREKVEYFAKEAFNLLIAGKEQTITLCTPHSRESIYCKWINEGHVPLVIPSEYVSKSHSFYQYVASHIKEASENNLSIIGKAVDERINNEVLEKKKPQVGKSTYTLQYLIDISENDDLKHPLKLHDLIVTNIMPDEAPLRVHYGSMPENEIYMKHYGFKGDRFFKPAFISEEKAQYQTKAISIDPKGRGIDQFGYSIGFILARKIFLKKIGELKGGGYTDENLMKIIELIQEFELNFLVYESNFGDGAFGKIIEPYIWKYTPRCAIVETRAHIQKERRIINTLEPLLNQHRLIIDKAALEEDSLSTMPNSFTYQLTHLTSEPNCLRQDGKIDSLEMLCKWANENFMNTSEDAMIYSHRDAETRKILEQNMYFAKRFGYRLPRQPNYADRY